MVAKSLREANSVAGVDPNQRATMLTKLTERLELNLDAAMHTNLIDQNRNMINGAILFFYQQSR